MLVLPAMQVFISMGLPSSGSNVEQGHRGVWDGWNPYTELLRMPAS